MTTNALLFRFLPELFVIFRRRTGLNPSFLTDYSIFTLFRFCFAEYCSGVIQDFYGTTVNLGSMFGLFLTGDTFLVKVSPKKSSNSSLGALSLLLLLVMLSLVSNISPKISSSPLFELLLLLLFELLLFELLSLLMPAGLKSLSVIILL